jgi:predicted mannosyl-3-phosphoglycerate phosphatase (HAD superfamily)
MGSRLSLARDFNARVWHDELCVCVCVRERDREREREKRESEKGIEECMGDVRERENRIVDACGFAKYSDNYEFRIREIVGEWRERRRRLGE